MSETIKLADSCLDICMIILKRGNLTDNEVEIINKLLDLVDSIRYME